MSQPPAPKPPERHWSSLAASAVVHTALLVLAVAVSRKPESPADRPQERAQESRPIQMVYLAPPPEPPPPPPSPPPPRPDPPPPPPATAPPPRPAAPPPERQPEPEPEANAPPDATRSEGEAEDIPEGGGTPAPVEEATPTLESEARRIFGRPRLATRPGAGPQATRPMEAYFPDDAAECVPRPRAESDSAGAPELGTAEGRIYKGDNGEPLAGAHLQMIGTPFTAFTDARGDYRFRFDLSLVDHCRTQYVRVTAKGYESRMLVLVVGRSVRSEDVHLKKRGWF